MIVRDFNSQHAFRDRKILEIEVVEDWHATEPTDGFWNCLRGLVEDKHPMVPHVPARMVWFPRYSVLVSYEVEV